MSNAMLAELKSQLAGQLINPERVSGRPGLPCGWPSLDHFLIWQGLPKGALSLFYGPAGLGATNLWLKCATLVTQNRRRAAWFERGKSRLCPWPLINQGLVFKQLLVIRPSSDDSSLWALQEILSSSLFDLVSFEITGLRLRESQIVKLRQLAQRSMAAVVLMDSSSRPPRSSAFHLVLRFDRHHLCIEKALHRPPLHLLPRKEFYAHPMPQLAQGRATEHRRDVLGL